MANSASLLNSKSEFDSFLFAPVGEDKRGTVVSVLTAFARLDFDPWQQAADFARLPKEAAKDRLAAMLATLPGMASSQIEPGTVAARLIPLLPALPRAAVGPGATWLGASQPANFRSPRYLISVAMFMALGFGSQFVIARLQPQQETSASTSAPSSATPSATVTGDPIATKAPTAGIVANDDDMKRDVIDQHTQVTKAQAPGAEASQAGVPVPSATPVRKPLFGS